MKFRAVCVVFTLLIVVLAQPASAFVQEPATGVATPAAELPATEPTGTEQAGQDESVASQEPESPAPAAAEPHGTAPPTTPSPEPPTTVAVVTPDGSPVGESTPSSDDDASNVALAAPSPTPEPIPAIRFEGSSFTCDGHFRVNQVVVVQPRTVQIDLIANNHKYHLGTVNFSANIQNYEYQALQGLGLTGPFNVLEVIYTHTSIDGREYKDGGLLFGCQISTELSSLSCGGTATLDWISSQAIPPPLPASVVVISYADGVEFARSLQSSALLSGNRLSLDAHHLPRHYTSLGMAIGTGSLDNPTILDSATSDCASSVGDISAILSNLTCAGAATLTWHHNRPYTGGEGKMIVIGVADGVEFERRVEATWYTGAPTVSLDLGAQGDGFDSLELTIGYGLPSHPLILARASVSGCIDNQPVRAALSNLQCDGSATLEWSNFNGFTGEQRDVVLIGKADGSEFARSMVSLTRQRLNAVHLDLAAVPAHTTTIEISVGTGPLESPSIVATTSSARCDSASEPDVQITSLGCDGTVAVSWSLPQADGYQLVLHKRVGGQDRIWVNAIAINQLHGTLIVHGPGYGGDLTGAIDGSMTIIARIHDWNSWNETEDRVTVGECQRTLTQTTVSIPSLTCQGAGRFFYERVGAQHDVQVVGYADGHEFSRIIVSLTDTNGEIRFTLPMASAGSFSRLSVAIADIGSSATQLQSNDIHCSGDSSPGFGLFGISELVCNGNVTFFWRNMPGAYLVTLVVNASWSEPEAYVQVDFSDFTPETVASSGSTTIHLPSFASMTAQYPDAKGPYSVSLYTRSIGAIENGEAGNPIDRIQVNCGGTPRAGLGALEFSHFSCAGMAIDYQTTRSDETFVAIAYLDGVEYARYSTAMLPSMVDTLLPIIYALPDELLDGDYTELRIDIGVGSIGNPTILASRSSFGCDTHQPAFAVPDISCNGSAVLTWSELDEDLAFNITPLTRPESTKGEILPISGTASGGSGLYRFDFDLSGVKGLREFGVIVSAGALGESQSIVAVAAANHCDSQHPPPEKTPPAVATIEPVTQLPSTGSGSSSPSAAMLGAIALLCFISLALALALRSRFAR